MRSCFAQQDHLGVLNYIVDSLNFFEHMILLPRLAQVINLVGRPNLVSCFLVLLLLAKVARNMWWVLLN